MLNSAAFAAILEGFLFCVILWFCIDFLLKVNPFRGRRRPRPTAHFVRHAEAHLPERGYSILDGRIVCSLCGGSCGQCADSNLGLTVDEYRSRNA